MDNFKKIIFFASLFFIIKFYNPVHGVSGSFYADNGRGQSVLYQTLKKKDKTELREEILRLLGLDHTPSGRRFAKHKKNNSHKSSAEKYLLDLYNALENSNARATFCKKNKACTSLLKDSDFIISFTNKIHHFTNLQDESDRRFYCDTSKISKESEIVRAELRVFRNGTNRCQVNKKYRYLISLYSVSEGNNANTLELVDKLLINDADAGKWLIFNVTTAVMKWILYPKKNLGLYLKVKSVTKLQGEVDSVSLHEIGISTSKAHDEYKAFIVAYFKHANQMQIRTRRTVKKKLLKSHIGQAGYNPYDIPQDKYVPKIRTCERWALYVSFRDLGFEDWIIAPDGYAAFYCDGSCTFPLNAQMNATNHAIVQTLMHLMDPTAVPKPSCAPTSLTAITVLYFDDHSNVILKKYKNMVVKSCGCH